MDVFWFWVERVEGILNSNEGKPGGEVHRKNGQMIGGVARRKSLDVDSVPARHSLQVDGKFDIPIAPQAITDRQYHCGLR